MSIKIIAAVARHNVIGKDNDLPWQIPEDLQHFKGLTWGKTVLMGRKTFESIAKRLKGPLPGRTNVVITGNKNYKVPAGVKVFPSFEEAIEKLSDDIWVIGGASIYEQAMPQADELYITHVDKTVAGDAYFPTIRPDEWKRAEEEIFDGYSFARYVRK